MTQQERPSRWKVELEDLAGQLSKEINLLQAICAAMGADGLSADSFTDGLFALTEHMTQLNQQLSQLAHQREPQD